mmetsp:Transcript_7458/g.11304  ORF Transcript_7458/g.11304 Transcript_7458/m.11304 type:complete len:121 (+) Transcript_7458:93-455(+)|eukprot:CAMPEP_0201544814 /NCGR_PEP_ID=MMETSP0173_2-20130828/1432_1 /ASSEMBLY_ACC=CAM_ASM_000268 /TAXON_ID=218659 /ORGANISM="Vexillifera sp., Strain DIVA3 564/2" /LENGTH=120 /DNA_ID=CAMNT_0047953073 /DNA_START=86 /DNA_END=448 /DNA_ORIENTATION=+
MSDQTLHKTLSQAAGAANILQAAVAYAKYGRVDIAAADGVCGLVQIGVTFTNNKTAIAAVSGTVSALSIGYLVAVGLLKKGDADLQCRWAYASCAIQALIGAYVAYASLTPQTDSGYERI